MENNQTEVNSRNIKDRPLNEQTIYYNLVDKLSGADKTIFTILLFYIINIVLSVLNINIQFIFTFFTPAFLIDIGKYLSSKSYNNMPLIISIVINFVIFVFLFLMYKLSKKHTWSLIIFLIFFLLDTVLLLFLALDAKDFIYILDVIFHGWVIYFLISYISNKIKFKNLYSDIDSSYDE